MRVQLYLAALIPALVGCYQNRPLVGSPLPSSRVAVLLTDAGRAESTNQLGPGALRVEGSVVSATDSAYLLSVSGVQPIRGAFVRWAGETVTLPRSYVAQAYERRLSRGRTAIVAGGAVGAIVLGITNASLLGIGGKDIPILPPPGGGETQ